MINNAKQEKFGIETLDALLGGGLTPGSAVLMVSEHPSTQISNFSEYFAGEAFKRSPNSRAIIIDYTFPAHHVLRLVTTPLMEKVVEDEKLILINCYGEIEYPKDLPMVPTVNLQNPTDISKLRYLVDTTREPLEDVEKVRWIVDDITNMAITIGSEDKVLRFLREFFFLLKKYNDLGLFYVDRKAMSPEFLAALENMCEAVILLNAKEISANLVPHLRVMKNRFYGENISSVEVPYHFSKTEIVIQADLINNFELFKKALSMTLDGKVELFGKRHYLLPEDNFLDTYKELYESLDFIEYKQKTYEYGKELAESFIAHYQEVFDLAPSEVFKMASNHFVNLGWGVIDFKKMSLQKGVVISEATGLYKFESLHPLHSNIAGFMARLTEYITGEPWDYFESKCVGTGNEICEFLGSPSKDLAPLSTDLRKIKDELNLERDGTLRLFGTRVLLIPRGTLLHIVESAEDIVGNEKAKEILYHAGERMALQFCQILTSKYNLEGAALIRVYMQIVSSRGWGVTEVKDLDLERGHMKLIVRNPLISTPGKSEANLSANSHLKHNHKIIGKDFISSGVFAGILEFITKKKLICEETKCISVGDKYCEFEVVPLDEYSSLVL